MSRLRSSLDYFEKSNPQSIELENIKALYDTGGDALNREFGEVLKKNSIATPAIELLNAISMPEEATEIVSIQHFPEGKKPNFFHFLHITLGHLGSLDFF